MRLAGGGVTSKLLARQCGSLILCALSASSFAVIFDGYRGAAGEAGLQCFCCWLAVWLFFGLFPPRAEQCASRLALQVFTYGPLSLLLFFTVGRMIYEITRMPGRY